MTLRKSVRTKKKDPAIVFELLTEKLRGRKPVRYSMSGSFKANDVIDHDTFGIGISFKHSPGAFRERTIPVLEDFILDSFLPTAVDSSSHYIFDLWPPFP